MFQLFAKANQLYPLINWDRERLHWHGNFAQFHTAYQHSPNHSSHIHLSIHQWNWTVIESSDSIRLRPELEFISLSAFLPECYLGLNYKCGWKIVADNWPWPLGKWFFSSVSRQETWRRNEIGLNYSKICLQVSPSRSCFRTRVTVLEYDLSCRLLPRWTGLLKNGLLLMLWSLTSSRLA